MEHDKIGLGELINPSERFLLAPVRFVATKVVDVILPFVVQRVQK